MAKSSAAEYDQAIALFKKALEIEPNSSLAHAYLSMDATNRLHFAPDRSFLELGRREAQKALELSPESAEAHRALAGVYLQGGRFTAALEQALETIERGGMGDRVAMFIGFALYSLGRPHEALRWLEVARQLSTKPGEADASIGDCWVKLGDDERAERAYNRATELRPKANEGIVGMARLRMLQGNFEAAREICQRTPEARGDLAEMAAQIEFFDRRFETAVELYRVLNRVHPYGGGSFYAAMSYCSAAGRAKQALGDMAEAKRLLEDCLIRERANMEREPENPEAPYRLAAAEACLGMTDSALAHLRKAVDLGWADHRSLEMDPRFDSLRGPEFQTIIENLSARMADLRNRVSANK